MSAHSRHPSTLKESVEERKREGGVGERGQPLLEKPQKRLKTQQRKLLEDTNRYLVRKSEHAETKLKRSWNEPCEPALENVAADQERTAAKLVAINFVKYH